MPIPFLSTDDDITAFPDVEDALSEPNGLLMAGGNLTPQRLMAAYRNGIFPWYEDGEPILWWSPDPRCVLWPEKMKISRSLRKTIRSNKFQITEDQAFRRVMVSCGSPRDGSAGTWVTQDMIDAYCRLHRHGLAKSIEIWNGDLLVGGLYGIILGRVFVGESMFSAERDASKIALAHLAACRQFHLIDCQLETPHLRSLGAEVIKRSQYIRLLREYGSLESDIFVNRGSAGSSDKDHQPSPPPVHGNPTTNRGPLLEKHG